MKGMLQKAKDFITWGEVSEETLAKMIKTRGRLMGDKPIDDAYVGSNSSFASIDAFAQSVVKDEAKYSDLKDIKPLFRLHPPIQGWEAVKKDLKTHGSLGYRGRADQRPHREDAVRCQTCQAGPTSSEDLGPTDAERRAEGARARWEATAMLVSTSTRP